MRVEVVWQDDDGSLGGWVEVLNDGPEVLRLGGRPAVVPLDLLGRPLDLLHAVTAVLVRPGYVDVPPGRRARAGISWGAWSGPPASGEVVVSWDASEVTVTARGPHQPARTTGALNTSSSWFALLP